MCRSLRKPVMDGSSAAMKAPLIPFSGRSHGGDGGGRRKSEVLVEVKRQLRLAVPFVLSSFLQFSLTVISLMFVGHLGELPLAGASMATSFAGVTGFSLIVRSFSPSDLRFHVALLWAILHGSALPTHPSPVFEESLVHKL